MKKILKIVLATLVGGFSMWVAAGLWHNLVLPSVNPNIHAHHDGLLLMLFAYFILAFFMVIIYDQMKKGQSKLVDGLKVGVIIGIVWVFPHGLAMAGVHDSSIIYEVKNALWHVVEQGIGGIVIAYVLGKVKK